MLLADQVQVDCGLGERGRHELFTLVSLNARAAACVGVVVEQMAVGRTIGPEEAQAIEGLAEAIERVVEALETAGKAGTRGSVAPTPAPVADDAVGREIGDIRDLLKNACEDARRALPAIEVFERARQLPDILTLTLRNLRDMADRVVLQPIRQPNPAMVKHAFKCSITIMICAVFCIAINWTMGIGCVETVMLVVQGTFGGTLLIGGLRMAGVVLGYAIAIMLIIFLIPTVTTLPGFWMVFGGTLFLTSWGVAGPPRVGVPCLQAMIVTDFALLQTTRPDISLLPAMNFALAVAMGVLVTVAVYWLLWPVKAGKVVRPTLAFMLQRVGAALHRAAHGALSGQAANVMQATIEEELAKCVAAHTNAQFERHESTQRHELELRAVMVVEQACHRVLTDLAAEAGKNPPQPEEAASLEAAAARFARAAAVVEGLAWQGEISPRAAGGRFAGVMRAAGSLDRLRGILAELDGHAEGEPIRFGVG
jgi:uncharacterized membrane protein YccC